MDSLWDAIPAHVLIRVVRRMCWLVILICTMVSAYAQGVSRDQDEDLKRKRTLGGRPTIALGAYVDPEIQEFLSEKQLSADIELILRRNSVPLGSEGSPGDGLLWLTVSGVASEDGLTFAILLQLQYDEQALTKRYIVRCEAAQTTVTADKALLCSKLFGVTLTVWEKNKLWLVGRRKVAALREGIKDLAEAFAVDYMKANTN